MKIWVDTDVAAGAPRGDVDDGFALAAVALYPGCTLLGVSVVSGNAPAPVAEDCARRLLAALGCSEVPVVPAGEPAARAMAALPPGTRILAIGPLSNVAAAGRRAPERLAHCPIHCVTGVSQPWRRPHWQALDLNFKRDPLAYWRLRRAGLPLVRYPLDVVQALRLSPATIPALARRGAIGAYLAEAATRWWQQVRWRHGAKGFPLWDLVAALGVMDALPGASHDAQGRLRCFDVAAATAAWWGMLPPD